MKVYSTFEAFEKPAKKFRIVHLSLFSRWLLKIFYHETQLTRRCYDLLST